MSDPFIQDLVEAITAEGCPLCTLTQRAVHRHLQAYAVEGVNDLDVRAKLRASRGYCRRHAHQFWRDIRHQLGVAMIYQDVVINLIRALEAADPAAANSLQRFMSNLGAPRARARSDAAALQPQADCPACTAEHDAERRYGGVLLRQLREPDWADRYRASTGLCLPHFGRLLAGARHDEQIAILVETQLTAWRALHKALGEYIRLQDYRFQHEPRGDEQRSPHRAILAISGNE